MKEKCNVPAYAVAKRFVRHGQDATGMRGAKKSTGKSDAEPLASRSVSNYELKKLGHYQ